MVTAITEKEKKAANDYSHTLTLLLPAFNKEKTKPADYLPYPVETKQISPETKLVLKKLIAAGAINRKAIALLGRLKFL
jgi:hypothetical protein